SALRLPVLPTVFPHALAPPVRRLIGKDCSSWRPDARVSAFAPGEFVASRSGIVASPVFDSRVWSGLLSGFVETCGGLAAPHSRQLASFFGQGCWLHGAAQLTTCSAGAACATVEGICSAELAAGVCMPLAGCAAPEFAGPETGTAACGLADFSASDLAGWSTEADGPLAVSRTPQWLAQLGRSVCSCGTAVPAPRQASAPATISTGLRDDRGSPPLRRRALLAARLNRPCGVAGRPRETDSCMGSIGALSVRSIGSNKFEGSSN